MKKTIIKLSLILSTAIIILIATVKLTASSNDKIASGTYKITDFNEYPEAYIKVKDDSIQFYNIDLNAIYQEKQIAEYNKYIEKYPDYALPDDKADEYSDLNRLLVQNPYYMNYDLMEDTKTGTFEYTYFLYPGDDNISFGLVILYDSLHKTIHINNAIQEITFKK